MKFEIETQRKEFITKYDLDIKKYTTDEIVDELEENISKTFLFSLYILLPILITMVISIITSVYFANSYNSPVFGVSLFVLSIPIFLFGVGSFGVINAINTLCSSIDYILNYTSNIVNDIKKINNVNNNEKNSDIVQFTLYGIIFPVVKKAMRNNFFGGALYFFIKKISIKGSNLLSDSYEENERYTLTKEIDVDISGKQFTRAHKGINDISKKVVTNSITIFKTFGVVSIIFGVVLEIFLFVVF